MRKTVADSVARYDRTLRVRSWAVGCLAGNGKCAFDQAILRERVAFHCAGGRVNAKYFAYLEECRQIHAQNDALQHGMSVGNAELDAARAINAFVSAARDPDPVACGPRRIAKPGEQACPVCGGVVFVFGRQMASSDEMTNHRGTCINPDCSARARETGIS